MQANDSTAKQPRLLSFRKPVNALGSGAAAITDGETAAGVHWDGGPAPAKAVIDLGGYFKISKIRVVTYYGDGRYYHFRALVSTGGGEYVLFGEKTDDTPASAEGTAFSGGPVTGRYVKIEMLKNSANPSVHIAECEVYGVEDEAFQAPEKAAFKADPADLAFGKPVRANSGSAFACFAVDGDPESYWIGENVPKFVDVDLLENYTLEKIVVQTPSLFSFRFRIYGSLNGVDFDHLFDSEEGASIPAEGENTALSFALSASKPYRVVRVMVTGSDEGANQSSMISGIRVYGKKSDAPVIPTRKTLPIPTYRDWLLEKHGVDIAALQDENGFYRPEQTYTEKDTVEALRGLVSRVLGQEYTEVFRFTVIQGEKDSYRVSSSDGRVKIEGRNGVSMAVGLNRYLKDLCHVHISQQTKQVSLPAPEKMPLPASPLTGECGLPLRYAYNYCTLSYTMPFFGYEDWQRELDFLMLSGVNLILDLTGTEALWVAYLQKLGYTADEAKDYVCGYCYKAWWLMGNLEGYCGPVSDGWVLDTLEMARQNQRYMTVMGAQPALQTFVGAMPESFASIAAAHLTSKGFSDVTPYMAPQGLWAGGFVRPNVLKTSYDGYGYLAGLFYTTQNEIYGQLSDYYCGDVCHEGGIVPADLSKPEMSSKILAELLRADPHGVWILQGWWSNPMKEVLDGFGALRKDHILILDLAALANPKWTNEKTWDGVEFGSTGWIFCNLDNYGGRTGMHGKLREMAKQVIEAMHKATMLKGIGITPEGTFANPAVFDLFWDLPWHEDVPDVDRWVEEYVLRRYGVTAESGEGKSLLAAWSAFEKTVYGKESYDGTTKNNVINENASFGQKYCVGPYFKISYDRELFEEGVDRFMEASGLLGGETYDYDAVDLLRMAMTVAADDYFDLLKAALAAGDKTVFATYSEKYLACMKTVRLLCAYNKDEMLGNWVGRAEDWCADPRNHGVYDDFTRDMMELNAKIILTVWASAPITNYAARQYDGLMEDYYEAMWGELTEKIKASFAKGEAPEPSLGGKRCYEIGWSFSTSRKRYPRTPLSAKGGEGVPSLREIYEGDVKPHLHNRASLQALTGSLTARAAKQAEEGGEELTATVATNIEH